MIADPVEGRGREHGVHRLGWLELQEVADAQVDGRAETFARRVDHRGRRVDADHPAARQAPNELFGDPARTAAGVHDALVARKLEALEDPQAHLGLRTGEAVIAWAIPLARRHR